MWTYHKKMMRYWNTGKQLKRYTCKLAHPKGILGVTLPCAHVSADGCALWTPMTSSVRTNLRTINTWMIVRRLHRNPGLQVFAKHLKSMPSASLLRHDLLPHTWNQISCWTGSACDCDMFQNWDVIHCNCNCINCIDGCPQSLSRCPQGSRGGNVHHCAQGGRYTSSEMLTVQLLGLMHNRKYRRCQAK